MSEQITLIVASFFKETTINKNRRLVHKLLRSPEKGFFEVS